MNSLSLFALLVVLSAVLFGCSSQPSTKTEKASGDPNQIIGHVKWTITETASGQTLGQGERDVKLGELKITTMSGTEAGELVHQKLPLSDTSSSASPDRKTQRPALPSPPKKTTSKRFAGIGLSSTARKQRSFKRAARSISDFPATESSAPNS